jgi:hypothetical protein
MRSWARWWPNQAADHKRDRQRERVCTMCLTAAGQLHQGDERHCPEQSTSSHAFDARQSFEAVRRASHAAGFQSEAFS